MAMSPGGERWDANVLRVAAVGAPGARRARGSLTVGARRRRAPLFYARGEAAVQPEAHGR